MKKYWINIITTILGVMVCIAGIGLAFTSYADTKTSIIFILAGAILINFKNEKLKDMIEKLLKIKQ